MLNVIRCLTASFTFFSCAVLLAPQSTADICMYPGVGVGVNVLVGNGGFCDYPTEINGSHMHCEAGGFGIGGGGTFQGDNGSLGVSGNGIGGASCSWRCPDNTLAPQPNPPGAWKEYMIPHPSACLDHMIPAGNWSEPVRPEEGIPPPAP